jgi:hypothetical protein
MRNNAEQRRYFLASCRNEDAVRTHENPQTIDRLNFCTLKCCVLVLESCQVRIRRLEELAGVGLGNQKWLDVHIQQLPQDHQPAALALRQEKILMLQAARVHWHVCGSLISADPVETNNGIRTSSRVDLGLDLDGITVEDQRRSTGDAFAPNIARNDERRLEVGEPSLVIEDIDLLKAVFGHF